MKQNLFQPRRRIEKRYEDAIKGIMGLMKRKLNGVSSPFVLLKTLRGIARSPTYDRLARQAAEAMATHLFTDGARSWREAALKGSKGRLIYKALRRELKGNATYWDIVERNADLIKTMPLNFAKKATKMMAENTMTGERAESKIEDIMRLWPHYTKAHARLIARTETSKAQTALTRTRSEEMGVRWYVWKTEKDVRVRKSHRKMDGVIIQWGDPPSPEELVHEKSYGHYDAGDIFNCRCYPRPLLNYDDVSWPHKVYYGGRIQTMTLYRFKALNGGGSL